MTSTHKLLNRYHLKPKTSSLVYSTRTQRKLQLKILIFVIINVFYTQSSSVTFQGSAAFLDQGQ